MLRAVVDTNVFISALLFGSTPRRVIDAFLDGKLIPIFSPTLFKELIEVLRRPSLNVLNSREEIETFLRLLQQDGILVRPTIKIHACRDPKDNMILECALAGKARYIITGDKDLLVLHPFRGIEIIRPREFLNLL